MMRYIYSSSTDPYFNLALEQYVFDHLDPKYDYFMLWQNDKTIVVGKYQNTAGEINQAFVDEMGIRVVRRLSGGGAVYHDLGNVNFTFIADSRGGGFDFQTFCEPVMAALSTLGVKAELSGRNDMTIDGKKFSGNAMYMKNGRVMHHGTMMYDSDVAVLSQALKVSQDKMASKGVKSVRSRVTNIKAHMDADLPVERYIEALRQFMFQAYEMEEYQLDAADMAAVCKLRDEVYSTWAWNFGASPQYDIHKARRIEGCGKIEIDMNVKEGLISAIRFSGDFFGNGDLEELCKLLIGCPLQKTALADRLAGVSIGSYCNNLSNEAFLSILL